MMVIFVLCLGVYFLFFVLLVPYEGFHILVKLR